ncbi:AP2 domain transcription factor AP2XII-5 [Babesia ovata]|uniref:AP2 domain transcription factor AP2XII-5 n=1 Tax=Babesia ovata TaxID=189622 RepID=A0A2H6KAX8_9APIC|nr:AP2 domain transcription factor AP2XII-5 [Babesia ovata]GBE60151.1 AP2 domain transcription factor AP2XII-5 [Babesia ovata]
MANLRAGKNARGDERCARGLPVLEGLSYDSVLRRWCVKVPPEICSSGGTFYFSTSSNDVANVWLSALYHWGRLIVCHLRSKDTDCPCGVCRSAFEKPGGSEKLSVLDFTEFFADGVEATSAVPSARLTVGSAALTDNCGNASSEICGCWNRNEALIPPDNLLNVENTRRYEDTLPLGSIFFDDSLSGSLSNAHRDTPRGVGFSGSNFCGGFDALASISAGRLKGCPTDLCASEPVDYLSRRQLAHGHGLPPSTRSPNRSSSSGISPVPDVSTAGEAILASAKERLALTTTHVESSCLPRGDTYHSAPLLHATCADALAASHFVNRYHELQTQYCTGACSAHLTAGRDYDNLRFLSLLAGHTRHGSSRKAPQFKAEGMGLLRLHQRHARRKNRQDRVGDESAHRRQTAGLTQDYIIQLDSQAIPSRSDIYRAGGIDRGVGNSSHQEDNAGSSHAESPSGYSSAVSTRRSTESKSQETADHFSDNAVGDPSSSAEFDDNSSMTDDSLGDSTRKSRRRGRPRSNVPSNISDMAEALRPWHREVFWVPSISRWRTSFTDETGTRHTKTFTPSVFGGVKEAYDAAVKYKEAVDQICEASGIPESRRILLKRDIEMSLKRKRLPRNCTVDLFSHFDNNPSSADDAAAPATSSQDMTSSNSSSSSGGQGAICPPASDAPAYNADALSAPIPRDLQK